MGTTSPSAIRLRPVSRMQRLLPHRITRRFVRQQDGTAAVEFALIAVPFLAMLFAILQTALVFFASQVLETGAAAAGRLVLTGQAQTAAYTQAQFKTQVCSVLAGSMFNCASGVYVDVETYTNFASANIVPPVQNGVFDPSKIGYAPGAPGDVVVVTLYYQWPIFVPLLDAALSNLNGDNRLLVATAVFRNEPYK